MEEIMGIKTQSILYQAASPWGWEDGRKGDRRQGLVRRVGPSEGNAGWEGVKTTFPQSSCSFTYLYIGFRIEVCLQSRFQGCFYFKP